MSRERLTELEAAVTASERDLGAEHPVTLDARVRLALGYRASERDENALVELREVLAIRDRTLGPDHPDALATCHEVALTYFHLSIGTGDGDTRLADAIATMERAAAGRVRVLGTAHPDTLKTWASLNSLYSQARRDDK